MQGFMATSANPKFKKKDFDELIKDYILQSKMTLKICKLIDFGLT